MGKSQPAAPAAPDYAAANEAGVTADINALPLRNAINAATTLGTSYTDPNTGRNYDFTGLGSQDIASAQLMQQLEDSPAVAAKLLEIQKQYGPEFAAQARASLQATDPTAFALRDQFGSQLASGQNSASNIVNQFNPQSYLKANPDLQTMVAGMTPEQANASLQTHWTQHGQGEGRTTGGTGIAAPTYEQYQGDGPNMAKLGQSPQFDELGAAPQMGGSTGIGSLARMGDAQQAQGVNAPAALQRFNESPQMQGVNTTSLGDRGMTAAGRSALEQSYMDNLSRVGTSDPSLDRAAQQAARARGASSGNLYGDGSGMGEALAVQEAQRGLDAQRRGDVQQFLQSGQSTSDTNNRLQTEQMQNDIAGAGFNNTALQQQYSNRFQNAGFNNQAAQQDFQNTRDAQQFNNAAGQQNFDNRGKQLTFNNAAAQQDYANLNDTQQFNNTAAQQNFDNQGKRTTFNNASRQQGFQNQAASTEQNNTADNQSFQNAMAAIGQRNQSMQNMFAGQQAVQQTKLAANQQDIANKQSYLGLSPIVAQGSMLSGLQQGAAPTTSGTGYGAVGTAQNAGQLGSSFAGNIFGTQANIFQTQSAAATAANGQMTGLASSFMCHVARLCYGEQNPRWVVFFYWKENAAPKLFKRFYNRFAPQMAAMLRPFPLAQTVVRNWMDSKINLPA